MHKKPIRRARVQSDANILEIIINFQEIYHYAPDTLDIACRLGYHCDSARRRIRALKRAGWLERLPKTANGYGWRIVMESVS